MTEMNLVEKYLKCIDALITLIMHVTLLSIISFNLYVIQFSLVAFKRDEVVSWITFQNNYLNICRYNSIDN